MKREKIQALITFSLVVLSIVGLSWYIWQKSQLLGQSYRYNLVLASKQGEVRYVSFDPSEYKIMIIEWPKELAINSRSVGKYLIKNLYHLGSYEGNGGGFVQHKVQGYMKVPIMGYIEVEDGLKSVGSALFRAVLKGKSVSDLYRLDALILWWRSRSYEVRRVKLEELERAGVLNKNDQGQYDYQEGRLREFIGKHMLDWSVGGENLSVVVLNNTRLVGLAGDVARFFENTGLAVVGVRTGEQDNLDATEVLISNKLSKKQIKRIKKLLRVWFGWQKIKLGDTSNQRAEIVIKVGKDAESLF